MRLIFGSNKMRGLLVGLAILLVVSSGCVSEVFLPGSKDASRFTKDDETLGNSEAAFAVTVYPIVRDHCSNCHGGAQAPLFAVPGQITRSHDSLLLSRLVDLEDPRSSRIVERVFRSHNCWTASCDDDGRELLDAVAQWAEMANLGGAGGPTGIVSPKVTVPADLSQISPGVYPKMSFDLSGLPGGVPNGTEIQVQVSRLDDETYLFERPILFSTENLYVKNIQVYVNDRKVDAQAFELIEDQFASDPGDGTLLVDSGSLLPVGFNIPEGEASGPGVDTIQLAFEFIGIPPDPQFLRFLEVRQVIVNHCAGCHGAPRTTDFLDAAGNFAQVVAFSQFAAPEQFLNLSYGIYQGSPRYLVVPGNANASGLYRAVAHGTPGISFSEYGPGGIADGSAMDNWDGPRAEIAPIIKAWIDGL